jgi:uncharacterized protein
MTDDLSAPLGQRKPVNGRIPLAKAGAYAAIGLLSLSLLGFVGWTVVVDDPMGGEPTAFAAADVRMLNTAKNAEEPSGKPRVPGVIDAPGPENTPSAPPGSRTVTIIDGSSGKRQSVVVPESDDKGSGAEDRLTERSRHGPVPKVAPDGARPADVFARPVKPIPGKPNASQIAIVVGGLGIGAAATNDAIRKLPGVITFAFAPYGGDLERQVARARADGHEIVLQAPMEPFDYPENDPGPNALLTTLDAAQNVDRLHWSMSRVQGYVGLANFMGTRFTSSEQALAPVLRETAKRGLIYFDDGSSARSLANQIAGANNLAFAKADIVLDVTPTAADIDRALSRLEAIAQERSLAIGFASALPVSIERIARWAKAVEGRGLQLVPITAAVSKPKSS